MMSDTQKMLKVMHSFSRHVLVRVSVSDSVPGARGTAARGGSLSLWSQHTCVVQLLGWGGLCTAWQESLEAGYLAQRK